jgi:TM2 domain-containing membrane protein YozV
MLILHLRIQNLSIMGFLQRYMADIGKAWPVLIVCGGILPLVLSVIWLLMIRHFVAAMPWITVALFNVLIVLVSMFYYLKGQEIFFSCSFPVCLAKKKLWFIWKEAFQEKVLDFKF